MSEKNQATFYVAPDGNDRWSGRLPTSNAAGTDGPFATLLQARDAIRDLKAKGPLAGPVTVMLRGGTYYLQDTLVFEPQDSGTCECPITYTAYLGETPVISGGRRITGSWKPYQGQIMVCDVKGAQNGGWVFRLLSADGKWQPRARLPHQGYHEIEEPASEVSFKYRAGDLQRWPDQEDAEVVVFHSWNESRFRIAALDESQRIVTFYDPQARHVLGWTGVGGPNRYYVENVLAGVQQPGDWYLDSRRGQLYYWPACDLESAVIVAPVLNQLLRLEGSMDDGRWVEHLHFQDLTFSDADWSLPRNGYPDCGDVGDIVEPSAITFVAARHCQWSNNCVKNTGTYALEVNGYSNRVIGNQIYDTGGGGILTRNFHPEHNILAYNHIHHCGLVFPSAVGINIDDGGGTIAHNLIHDITHSGIYTRHWATATQPRERRNQEQGLVIEQNEIHHVMLNINDGAGIFVRDAHILIRNNLIHDVYAGGSRCPGWGIYLGCETRDTRVENNLVYRTLESVHVWYYDRNITLENNIFVGARQCQINYQNPENLAHRDIRFVRNIVYCTEPGGHLFSISGERSLPVESDYNVMFSAIGCVLNDPIIKGLPGTQSFAQWRERGLDEHTITADPLFADLAHDDFTLLPDSPAFRVGFVPLDMSTVGPRGQQSGIKRRTCPCPTHEIRVQ